MGNSFGKMFGAKKSSFSAAEKETGVVASTTSATPSARTSASSNANAGKLFDSALIAKYEAAGQGHVFAFADKLSAGEAKKFSAQLEAVDLAYVTSAFKSSTGSESIENVNKKAAISAFPLDQIAAADSSDELKAKWNQLGLDAIRKGELAAVVLSGGQGTRLGFSGPKGMYDFGLPSHKTLFRLQAERMKRLGQLSGKGGRVPWYIMTSPLNDAATREYFKSNNYFGLKSKDVMFFAQGTLPCMTTEGKLILQDKCTLATAPDGNGGIYTAMLGKGVLKVMEQRGVKYIHAFSIDNALVQVADPIYVGYCIENDADVGNKCCPKASWDEAVGVMALRDGKPHIVEYSEIDDKTAKAVDPDSGRLAYGSGNICNHFYTLDFIKNKAVPALSASYHVAHKKIPFADPKTGETVKPTSNNGIKLELFIFDVFPLAKSMAVMECKREEEFAPVKNAPGHKSDSPDTARELTSGLARQWLLAAGATVEGDEKALCEVSPLVSVFGEGLEESLRGETLKAPCMVVASSEEETKTGDIRSSSAGASLNHRVDENGVNVYAVDV